MNIFRKNLKRRNSAINPYSLRVHEFPDRIFSFENPEEDIVRVKALLSQYGNCFVEIGSGSGNHLIAQAKKNPSALYFGFEIRYKRSVRTIEKAKGQGIDNVFVLRINAKLIDQIIPKKSLSGIYLLFPDPWEKRKRQHKRLMNASFLAIASSLLIPGGFVSFRTDHAHYFRFVMDEVRGQSAFNIEEETDNFAFSIYEGRGDPISEFEALFRNENLPIHYLRLILKPIGRNSLAKVWQGTRHIKNPEEESIYV